MAEPPPAYDEVVGPYSNASIDNAMEEFWPSCLNEAEKAKYGVFETFRTLMERANEFLRSHPFLEAYSCETIEKRVYNVDEIDDGSAFTCHNTSSAVRIKGLRIWVRKNLLGTKQKLCYGDLIPSRAVRAGEYWECDGLEYNALSDVVERFNTRERRTPFEGRIISINTVQISVAKFEFDPDEINSDSCSTYDNYKYHRLTFLRVFLESGPPAEEIIGLADFTPDVDQAETLTTLRSYHAPSCLQFPHVMDKVKAWLKEIRNLRVTNIQTISTRYKKLNEYGNRLDTMCAYEYKAEKRKRVNFVRVAYAQKLNAPDAVRNMMMPPLSHRNFYPVLLTGGSTCEFESFRKTYGRMMMWLRAAKARILCIETAYKIGRHKYLSRELMAQQDSMIYDGDWYTTSNGDGGTEYHRCPVLAFIRVYILGPYEEPPAHMLPEVPEPEIVEECVVL